MTSEEKIHPATDLIGGRGQYHHVTDVVTHCHVICWSSGRGLHCARSAEIDGGGDVRDVSGWCSGAGDDSCAGDVY